MSKKERKKRGGRTKAKRRKDNKNKRKIKKGGHGWKKGKGKNGGKGKRKKKRKKKGKKGNKKEKGGMKAKNERKRRTNGDNSNRQKRDTRSEYYDDEEYYEEDEYDEYDEYDDYDSSEDLYDAFGEEESDEEEEEDCGKKKEIELPRNRECLSNQKRLDGERGLILGWGKDDDDEKSDVLREVKLTVISNQKCMETFEKRSESQDGENSYDGSNQKIIKEELCAGSTNENGIKAQCSGDSGGPLIFKDPKDPTVHVIEGIASWGAFYNRGCAFTNRPDVFARISHYVDWIEDIVFEK